MNPTITTPSAGAAGSVPTVAAVGADPAAMAAPGKKIHALMIVAADNQEDLGEHVLRYIHNLGIHAVQLVYLQDGAVRQDEPGHEHFGFRDGVSQPGVRHLDSHVGSLTSEKA